MAGKWRVMGEVKAGVEFSRTHTPAVFLFLRHRLYFFDNFGGAFQTFPVNFVQVFKLRVSKRSETLSSELQQGMLFSCWVFLPANLTGNPCCDSHSCCKGACIGKSKVVLPFHPPPIPPSPNPHPAPPPTTHTHACTDAHAHSQTLGHRGVQCTHIKAGNQNKQHSLSPPGHKMSFSGLFGVRNVTTKVSPHHLHHLDVSDKWETHNLHKVNS